MVANPERPGSKRKGRAIAELRMRRRRLVAYQGSPDPPGKAPPCLAVPASRIARPGGCH